MPNLPSPILAVLAIFSPLFSKPTLRKFLTLFHGHILCKGFRTVTGLLKRLGLKDNKNFSNYHDFFNKNKWSALDGAKILFLKLIALLPNNEIIYISIDSTVERRKGPQIKSLNIQRDAVRSTKSRKILVPGLNWLVCTLHIKLPWGDKIWALPFLTILMPPEQPLTSSKNKKDLKKSLRRHLGMETQRQWSDMAIDRETPCILASFSIITLIALELQKANQDQIPIQTSSWYSKKHITFSDILAYVRRHILGKKYLSHFDQNTEMGIKELEEIINQMVAA